MGQRAPKAKSEGQQRNQPALTEEPQLENVQQERKSKGFISGPHVLIGPGNRK